MAANYVVERRSAHNLRSEIVFAGDSVRLAGQVDYPPVAHPENRGFPLMFLLHQVGWHSRDDYRHYAHTALNVGYAVFRWDKRGTGRSGASGCGSAMQDAVKAYETALQQRQIDSNRVVILAPGDSSRMLGEAFGLFARVARPAGVILVGNMLDVDHILAIDAPLQIIQGARDWHKPEQYANQAARHHQDCLPHGASYFIAPGADRDLMVGPDNNRTFHLGVVHKMQDWLKSR
jgi:uncharacterized protein